ncbi:MAG: epoxyqueuosine reductase QueH [Planctomycetia bacterium]|nr:epoxyqueuosine reductase QueH [Planctomycetia bacterium]
MKTNILLHICCAPCSVACVKTLRADDFDVSGYWNNPNIHPYTEYKARRDCLREYAEKIDLKLILDDEYGLRTFVRNVSPNFNTRCEYCYRVRLEATASYAAQNGFEGFSTTLLISPYQKHDLLAQMGEEIGEKYGVPFVYRDFRPLFRSGQQEARELGLYMQKYCGCIFSEEERYLRKKQRSKE